MNFQQILFPVDFSDACNSVAKHVSAMASLFHAKITLVHAVEDPLKWYGHPNPEKVLEADIPKVLSDAEESLESFAETRFPDVDAGIVFELGGPLDLIEKTALGRKADLIMMPTHGRGRFRAGLLGSVTAKVLHDLPIAVWTEAHAEANPPEHHLPIRKIACAIDLGPNSVHVLRSGSDFAKRCGASMFIAHGVPVAEMELGAYSKVAPPVYMEDFGRAEIGKLQAEAGTAAEVWIESGPIGSVVRKAALEWNADLVVMGRGKISHLAGCVGAHAYPLIRDSPCPVLSI